MPQGSSDLEVHQLSDLRKDRGTRVAVCGARRGVMTTTGFKVTCPYCRPGGGGRIRLRPRAPAPAEPA